MSSKNPFLYQTTIKNSEKDIVLYDDPELKIEAQIVWENQTTIETLVLKSTGSGKLKYRILKIQPCLKFGINLYLVHIHQHTDASIDPHTYTAGNKTDIPNLIFEKSRDIAIFRFNIYQGDNPVIQDCNFLGGDPETKDGAIIVSI